MIFPTMVFTFRAKFLSFINCRVRPWNEYPDCFIILKLQSVVKIPRHSIIFSFIGEWEVLKWIFFINAFQCLVTVLVSHLSFYIHLSLLPISFCRFRERWDRGAGSLFQIERGLTCQRKMLQCFSWMEKKRDGVTHIDLKREEKRCSVLFLTG